MSPLKPELERLRQKTPKAKVRMKLRNAVFRGEIKRPKTCECCGTRGLIEAHHDDYRKPFDVQWLCHKCHVQRHYKLAA